MSDSDEQRKQDDQTDVEAHLRRLNEQDGGDEDQAPQEERKQDVAADVEGHVRRLNEQDGDDVEGHVRR